MSAALHLRPSSSLGFLLRGYGDLPDACDVTVAGVTVDSRQITSGDVFAALAGIRGHGLAHVGQAIAQGAGAVIYDPSGGPDVETAQALCDAEGVPLVAVDELGACLGAIASRAYGDPSEHLCCIGVTGTDGKTSVSQFLAGALQDQGARSGVVGTLGYGFPGGLHETGLTTPDAATVQRLLRELVADGASHVAMEVSSHALVQHRVASVRFDTAVLTNLGRDHLDYHGSSGAYAEAKRRLFQMEGLRLAVLNMDDALGMRLRRELPRNGVEVLCYSLDCNADAEIICTSLRPEFGGLGLSAVTPVGTVDLRLPLLGRFNGANVLAVIGALVGQGFGAPAIEQALGGLRPVPGRMEPFAAEGRALAVVDYAHTPGALMAALSALRQHVPGRIWCVFGCGGDRDAGKRPLMGAAAERIADTLIITDDNPRNENPDAIISAITSGLRRSGSARIIRDRAEAIAAALGEAGPDDAVLIAGKGHETYQLTATGRHDFSDRDVVRRLQAGGES